MEINEIYVEESLSNDAAKIVIDEEFKCDLKNKIMFADKYNNITELPKRKNDFKKNRYFKIASGFVICVFVSGTIFKVLDIPSKGIFTKSKETSNSANPIVSMKGSIKDNSKQANALKAFDDIIKDNYKNKQLMAIKGSSADNIINNTEGKTINTITDNPLEAYIEKSGVNINEITRAVIKRDSDAEINQGLVNQVHQVSPLPIINKPVDKPDVNNVDDGVTADLVAYDSRYSADAKKLVSVQDDGIYIKDVGSSNEKKLLAYNETTQIVDKPNFTPTDGVIYYKADKVNSENGVSSEKNGAIYLADKNGKSTKIADGKDPMISKDGKSLVYEFEGQIFLQNLEKNDSKGEFLAIGKYPAFSSDGNLISYVKEGTEVQSPNLTAARRMSIQKMASNKKTISTLCVYDLTKEKNQGITDEGNEGENIDSSIQSWSGAIRDVVDTSDLDVTSKYSYYESIWSLDNKEVSVIRKDNDNEAKVYDIIKFQLDK